MEDAELEQDLIDFEDAEIWGGDAALVDIEFTDQRIWGMVPLDRITAVCNPLRDPPWYDGQGITAEGVGAALREGRFELRQYSLDRLGPDWTVAQHEERIAWLVQNPQTDPIEIEFSHPNYETFSIDDGNHRLAAAIYRQDAAIAVQLGGYFGNCVRALGIICRPLQRIEPAPQRTLAPVI
jgi:hypothetical protein|nr:hypothetical protein [Neorhizobium tomejilense]